MRAEGKGSREIAKTLKKGIGEVVNKMTADSFHTPIPGEVTTYIDEQGRTITKCPPGYAYGAQPQRNIRARTGY